MATRSKTNFEQDPELKAMLNVFAALKDLDTPAQNRVMEYVERRLGLERSSGRQSQENEHYAPGASVDSSNDRDQIDTSQTGSAEEGDAGDLEGISPIAKKWMRRNDLSEAQVSQLFSLGVDEIDLVAKKVPGDSTKERLRNVLLLQGIAAYLSSGAPRVDNDKLREATRHYDSDVGGNFATYLKEWASEISGSRSAGDLTLTTRGLNAAKELIKQMAGDANAKTTA